MMIIYIVPSSVKISQRASEVNSSHQKFTKGHNLVTYEVYIMVHVLCTSSDYTLCFATISSDY